ncbi:hypothetical protein [Deinococcus enclensis]|uniref:Uncharacterized protein n=1 Tax=Deinococcus enclensis TaxID=1049582 RepID=A0ABT9MFR5_9DEIO|nr:hypothetical protein [Deinococcus enclensis]MDP9765400.1 hypothetical protein [Deinococcus enclensis]
MGRGYALGITTRDHLPSRDLDAGTGFPYGVPSAALILLDTCTDGDEAAAAFGIAPSKKKRAPHLGCALKCTGERTGMTGPLHRGGACCAQYAQIWTF